MLQSIKTKVRAQARSSIFCIRPLKISSININKDVETQKSFN